MRLGRLSQSPEVCWDPGQPTFQLLDHWAPPYNTGYDWWVSLLLVSVKAFRDPWEWLLILGGRGTPSYHFQGHSRPPSPTSTSGHSPRVSPCFSIVVSRLLVLLAALSDTSDNPHVSWTQSPGPCSVFINHWAACAFSIDPPWIFFDAGNFSRPWILFLFLFFFSALLMGT